MTILLATIVVMCVVVEKRSHSLFINLHCLKEECLGCSKLGGACLKSSKLLFEKAPKQIPPPPKKGLKSLHIPTCTSKKRFPCNGISICTIHNYCAIVVTKASAALLHCTFHKLKMCENLLGRI